MAESFPFRLITPTGIAMDAPVEEVIAHSALGEFGVLPNHINFVTALIPGVLRVKSGAAREADYVVTGGLAVVRDGAMTVLADDVESPDQFDRTAVASDARTADDRLGQTSFYAPEYADAERASQLARARQQATELTRSSH
jgi:F-type H+-transporting ATPase subunit epsilon